MTEINYGIFDDISNLPIKTLDNKYIRNYADSKNISYSEAHKELKDEIYKKGIKYFIPNDKEKIQALPIDAVVKCLGTYFERYEDAVNELLNKVKENDQEENN